MADTLNINSKAATENSFDAIVIGSGISGGWAAKELCEQGIKTLVLERGRNVATYKRLPDCNQTSLAVYSPGKNFART